MHVIPLGSRGYGENHFHATGDHEMRAQIIQYVEGRRYYYAGDETFMSGRENALLVPIAEVARLVEHLSEENPHPLVVEPAT